MKVPTERYLSWGYRGDLWSLIGDVREVFIMPPLSFWEQAPRSTSVAPQYSPYGKIKYDTCFEMIDVVPFEMIYDCRFEMTDDCPIDMIYDLLFDIK